MKMTLFVRGKTQEWDFVVVDQQAKYLQDMRDDGLEIYPLVNEIPPWFPFIGLWNRIQSLWCKVQDLFCKE